MTTLNNPARSPRAYAAPVIEELGLVTRLTMGNGGSSLDGNCTFTQRGRGNDGQPDGGPASCGGKGNSSNR